jgi:glycerophosphoryl diester phosphodiesterase
MKGIVIVLFCVVLAACGKNEFECTNAGHIQIIAHRGVTYQSSENGLRALRQSVDIGLDGVEFDIQMTRDSQIVVFHDNDLLERVGVQGSIHNYTLHELQEFRLKDQNGVITDETIPTLREVLELIGGKIHCFIEIKSSPTFSGIFFGKELVKILNEYNMDSSKVTIISFYINQLAFIYSLNESLPLCLIMYDEDKLADVEALNPGALSYGSDKNYFYRLSGLILHSDLCRKSVLVDIREKANVQNIYIYDVKSLKNISNDNFQWIDGIITDYPQESMLLKTECR